MKYSVCVCLCFFVVISSSASLSIRQSVCCCCRMIYTGDVFFVDDFIYNISFIAVWPEFVWLLTLKCFSFFFDFTETKQNLSKICSFLRRHETILYLFCISIIWREKVDLLQFGKSIYLSFWDMTNFVEIYFEMSHLKIEKEKKHPI